MPESAETSQGITTRINEARSEADRTIEEAILYQSFRPIAEHLSSSNAFLRSAVNEAVLSGAGSLGPAILSQGLRTTDEFIRNMAAKAIVSINSQDAIDALSAEITVGNVHYCATSIDTLGKLRSKEASSALITKLAINNVHIRLLTVEALAYYKNADATRPLIKLLRDRDDNVRKAVIVTLGKIGDPRAAAPIMTSVSYNPTWPIDVVVEALGNIGNVSAVGFVCSVLSTHTEVARAAAAEALGKLRHEGSAQSLCKALRDPSSSVRRKAVEALGKIQSRDSIPPLRARLALFGREPNSEIRSQIAKLLAEIDPPALRTSKLPRTTERESPKPETRPRSRNAAVELDARPRNVEEPEASMND